MNDTVREDLIESREDDNNYYLADDDTDGSHFIYAINMILSGTARLNVLLPTATILAFTIFAPLLTNDGKCDTLSRWLMGFFLVFSAASCVFFSVTDSFRTATGRLYYGVATFNGIWTFNGGRKKPCVPSDYRLRWADLFHTSLSLIAFLTFAASHTDVLECYYRAVPRKVINSAPLVVGFVISFLFVMFPSRRRGIGYPFLLQRDALYCRN
ncbi:protein DMP2-like [Cornus florida]|uniref:protein DMP2-like n=1 Tax=Cornus florida TaxID=4283 RepID=UPI00289EB3AA|nr:protein DMP2-like [Cornus florida]